MMLPALLLGLLAGIPVAFAASRIIARIEGKPFAARKLMPAAAAATLACTLLVHYRFGFSVQCVAALTLAYALVTLSVIDLRTFLLPDMLTLPLIAAGLAVNMPGLFVPAEDALIGAMAGYAAPWVINEAFRRIRKKDGMGGGDFKLLAALGAWAGWAMLPLILFLGSLIGLGFALALKVGRQQPFPFGPALALGGLVSLCYGNDLLAWYTGIL